MRAIPALLLLLSAALLSESFKNCISGRVAFRRTVAIKSSEEEPPQAPESYEKNKDGSFSDKTDVKATLSQLMAVLSPLAPSNLADGVLSEEKLVQQVQDGFSKILEGVRESSMTPMEKRLVITEANIILSDMKTKEGTRNVANNNVKEKGKIYVAPPATVLFSQKSSPYLLVYGPGVVGQEVLKKMKKLGKSIDLKIIDGEFLGVMTEKEIEFAVRNVKTIIIAADSKKVVAKGGWFGSKEKENTIIPTPGNSDPSDVIEKIDVSNSQWDQLLNEKSLKKLLNATMKESNKNGNVNIKVVALCKATKQSKGIASFLGGENTELDSEIILQCKSRGLGYAVIKVGSLIDDISPCPPLRERSPKGPKYSKEEEEITQAVYSSPVLFTASRVEESEVTRLSLAVEAVLRSAAHPVMNSTISVITSFTSPALPTDAQWDDEFLRLDGPELERIPLKFSSVSQMVLRLGLIIEELRGPGGGLVTPIDVERYDNGVRVIFKPLDSTYSSKNDDKKNEKKLEAAKEVKKTPEPPKYRGYLSPEMEKEEEERVEKEKKVTEEAQKSVVTKKSGSQKLEGGLEIIVESEPYRRVRVRRCLMGAQTIVKEESEAVLLRAILKGIQVLENDYRVAIMTSMKT